MVADKGKKAKVSETGPEEDSDHIDGELAQLIEKLQEVQDELEKVNEEASEKVVGIEQKYNEMRRPAYEKRNKIINNIPDFWLTAFLSHPALCDLLSEEDQKMFKYLSSLDVEDYKDVKSGYSITFIFKENPYFENTKLIKTFTFTYDGETNITGTIIKWKSGMGVANGVNHEKPGNKRPPSDESFFSWFGETELKDIGENDEVADIIKEDLWPNPIKYFSNEADEEDSDEDEGEEENGNEDHDEDEDVNEGGS